MERSGSTGFDAAWNPLLSDSSSVWDRLIEAVGPASILVIIENRMSASLKRQFTPEDVWQEALLHAWRDRSRCQWRGLKSFRSWLLTIIDHRIRDAADYDSAAKRGGGTPRVPFSVLESSESTSGEAALFPGPIGSTTPSRIAVYSEQAAAMRAALSALPKDVRDVVRLRLFEQLTAEQVADRLGIGVSAVRHRFRKGALTYRQKLRLELSSRSLTISPEVMNAFQAFSASDE